MITGLEPFAAPIVAITVIVLFAAFAREWRPPEVTAAVAVSFLLVIGLIDVEDLLGVLSNNAPITIAAMFVISAALVRTGALDAFARLAVIRARSHPGATFVVFLVGVAAMSAFMNNTPLVVIMIPVAVALAREMSQSSSKLLIPLSYASILGGTCTLIGTSTNIIIDGVARQAGLAPFHIFEIAPLGVASAIAGIAVLFVFRRLLPDRVPVSSALAPEESRKFVVELVVDEESGHVGQAPGEVAAFNRPDRRVIDVVRGTVSLRRRLGEVVLEAGDIVVLRISMAELFSMKEEGDIATAPPDQMQSIGSRSSTVVEVLIGPDAGVLGKTLRHLRFRRRYGVYPMALHRRGANLADRFETTPLQVGDTLLLEGAPEDVQRLVEDAGLVNVSAPAERGFRRAKAPIAVGAMVGVVGLASFGLMPIAGLAAIGAAVVLATRCVEPDEAVQAVDWRVLGLIVCMLCIGVAMEKSELIAIIVSGIAPLLAAVPPLVALAMVYLMASILTELVTNNAVAIIVTPIAIGLALSLGIDPRPLVVAVMFASSASFLTPIGYQTNTLVYNAGGYLFFDFVKVGLAMNVTVFTIAMLLIPVFWPL